MHLLDYIHVPLFLSLFSDQRHYPSSPTNATIFLSLSHTHKHPCSPRRVSPLPPRALAVLLRQELACSCSRYASLAVPWPYSAPLFRSFCLRPLPIIIIIIITPKHIRIHCTSNSSHTCDPFSYCPPCLHLLSFISSSYHLTFLSLPLPLPLLHTLHLHLTCPLLHHHHLTIPTSS